MRVRYACDIVTSGAHEAPCFRMSLKRTDLAKSLNLKIQGQMQHAAIPSRFAQAAALPDRREQRKLDQAAGLVPFAVKLHKDLVALLTERAAARQVPLHALVDEVLRAGLAQQPAEATAAPVAKKAAIKAAAEKAPAAPKVAAKKAAPKPNEKKGPAEKAPAKKATASKAAAKKAAAKAAR